MANKIDRNELDDFLEYQDYLKNVLPEYFKEYATEMGIAHPSRYELISIDWGYATFESEEFYCGSYVTETEDMPFVFIFDRELWRRNEKEAKERKERRKLEEEQKKKKLEADKEIAKLKKLAAKYPDEAKTALNVLKAKKEYKQDG